MQKARQSVVHVEAGQEPCTWDSGARGTQMTAHVYIYIYTHIYIYICVCVNICMYIYMHELHGGMRTTNIRI